MRQRGEKTVRSASVTVHGSLSYQPLTEQPKRDLRKILCRECSEHSMPDTSNGRAEQLGPYLAFPTIRGYQKLLFGQSFAAAHRQFKHPQDTGLE